MWLKTRKFWILSVTRGKNQNRKPRRPRRITHNTPEDWSGGGKGEHKHRTVVKFTLGADRAPVGAHSVFDNGEAETSASRLARACLVDTVEALEQARQMLGRYARTKVADIEFHGLGDGARSQHNPAPRRAVLEGIVD